jgi:hypothetical protein
MSVVDTFLRLLWKDMKAEGICDMANSLFVYVNVKTTACSEFLPFVCGVYKANAKWEAAIGVSFRRAFSPVLHFSMTKKRGKEVMHSAS